MKELDAVYHRLRYYIMAATLSFLVLALLVGFTYRQVARNQGDIDDNRVLLCGAYVSMGIDLPEQCQP